MEGACNMRARDMEELVRGDVMSVRSGPQITVLCLLRSNLGMVLSTMANMRRQRVSIRTWTTSRDHLKGTCDTEVHAIAAPAHGGVMSVRSVPRPGKRHKQADQQADRPIWRHHAPLPPYHELSCCMHSPIGPFVSFTAPNVHVISSYLS